MNTPKPINENDYIHLHNEQTGQHLWVANEQPKDQGVYQVVNIGSDSKPKQTIKEIMNNLKTPRFPNKNKQKIKKGKRK